MHILLRRITASVSLGIFSLCFALGSQVAAENQDSRPVVYLTFDDGPSADSVTEDILAVLASHDAKATFFVTGERSRKSPEKISAILYGGHAIGNHTHSHVRLTDVSSEEVFQELQSASQSVLNAGGPPLTCYRPPFGSMNNRVNSVAESIGLTPVTWTLDTRDWHPNVMSDSVYETLNLSQDQSIVLMHDGPNHRGKTARAFAYWMYRNADNYQFKSLPDCDTYGAGAIQVADVEREEQTIDGLLEKLRGYELNLLQAEQKLDELHQLTANLQPDLIKP